MEAAAPLTLALAGQPNVGKSTVFNGLTGLNQHVGNWPGKTVEQKTGRFEHRGLQIDLVDLPGTYSLTSGSEEERVTRDYLINEPPAAAVAFGFQQGYLDERGSSRAPQHILVYDLGGGTFDATLLKLAPGDIQPPPGEVTDGDDL